MKYPKWIRAYQQLDNKRDDNPSHTLGIQLESIQNKLHIKEGDSIAVTVGSRSISNLVPLTKRVIDFLKSKGAAPFLVPAMGSHGAGTSEGQRQLLEELGFTERSMEVPVLSSMEVVLLGEVEGIPIYMDKIAFESKGVIVINRLKPHQVFKGDIQSGLNKMLALGLGKKRGAEVIHLAGRGDVLGQIGDFICLKAPILFGVAILENSYSETRNVAVVFPQEFKEIDRRWAKESRSFLPRIPFRSLDLVLVDEMGKNISGSGMDTNVIGFTRHLDNTGKAAVPLAVCDLTEESDGNALGMGLADFMTQRLKDKVDFSKTYTNAIATGIYSAGRIPITLESEREILNAVLEKYQEPVKTKIVRIKNTLHLEEFLITEALIPEAEKNDKIRFDGELIGTDFDDSGRLSFGWK